MWLIVGLGNPGKEYAATRHNAGWLALDVLAKNLGATPWRALKKFKSEIAEAKIGRTNVLLLKPQTFMNESGSAVAAAATFYKIKPNNIIVVHDDLDFPMETVRVQFNRSSAGHNGVQDVIAKLGGQEFHRVRIGISNPTKTKGKDFVLAGFSPADVNTLKIALDKAIDLIKNIITNRP